MTGQAALLRKISWASLLASFTYLVDYTFQFVDMYFLAQLGPGTPTALTTIAVYIELVLLVGAVAGSGSISIISQALGATDFPDARRKIMGCLQLKIFLGCFVMAPLFLFVLYLDDIFVPKDPTVQSYIWEYARVIWLSLILISIYGTLMTVLRALDAWGMALSASLIALVGNIIATPALVFGWWGLPALGMVGGAIGAVVAQFVTLVVSAVFVVWRAPYLLPRLPEWLRWDYPIYRKIMVTGLPLGMTFLILQIEAVILVWIFNQQPVNASDAFAIVLRIIFAMLSINIGVSIGAGIISGSHIGANDTRGLKPAIATFTVMFMVVAAIIGGVLILLSDTVIGAFTLDPSTIVLGSQFLFVYLMANVPNAGFHVIVGFFEGHGGTAPIIIVMIVAHVLIEFPLLLLLHDKIDPMWVFGIVGAASVIAFTMLSHRFYRTPLRPVET